MALCVCIEKYFSFRGKRDPVPFFFLVGRCVWPRYIEQRAARDGRTHIEREREEPAVVGAPVFCLAWLPFLPPTPPSCLRALNVLISMVYIDIYIYIGCIYSFFSLSTWALPSFSFAGLNGPLSSVTSPWIPGTI